MNYYSKYIKYKNKYILEKKRLLRGGSDMIQQIKSDQDKIKKNIVGRGRGRCTGFKITPNVILTATHCCHLPAALKKIDAEQICKQLNIEGFNIDSKVKEYINSYVDNKDNASEIDGESFAGAVGYLDFMILTKTSSVDNKMVVPFLPPNAEMKNYKFEWVDKNGDDIKFIPFEFKDNDAFENYKYRNLAKEIKSDDFIYSGNSGSPVFAINKNTGKYFFIGVMSAAGINGPVKDGVIIDVHKLNEVNMDTYIEESRNNVLNNRNVNPDYYGINNLGNDANAKIVTLDNTIKSFTKTNKFKKLLKERLSAVIGEVIIVGILNEEERKRKEEERKRPSRRSRPSPGPPAPENCPSYLYPDFKNINENEWTKEFCKNKGTINIPNVGNKKIRKIKLDLHPDKNGDCTNEAEAKFKEFIAKEEKICAKFNPAPEPPRPTPPEPEPAPGPPGPAPGPPALPAPAPALPGLPAPGLPGPLRPRRAKPRAPVNYTQKLSLQEQLESLKQVKGSLTQMMRELNMRIPLWNILGGGIDDDIKKLKEEISNIISLFIKKYKKLPAYMKYQVRHIMKTFNNIILKNM
jgi:hypothetical protein